ncbi:MAG: VOC family protein [Sandaracinus sp.]|nr:VOC family protein [Sandaracinus sp.]MCB9616576.1 VOC family protein [Sandaracinus sp.]MCB9622504.1 VOC family protein [Sandaracinus sp.]
MTIQKITPYLHFCGDAVDALAHYEKTLGAQVVERMLFGDMKEHPFGPDVNHLVMHSMLRIGEAVVMISDVPPGESFERGMATQVVLELDDGAQLETCFDALAEGGAVRMPLHDAFWGARFGMVTDKFGVRWMLTGPLR